MGDSDESNPLLAWTKKRGNVMMHSVTMMLVTTLLSVNFYGGEVGLATRAYVDARVSDNTKKLDRILELQTAEEIDKLLRWRCMHPGDTSFDDTLRSLEIDYREITGEPYERPPCAFLLDNV